MSYQPGVVVAITIAVNGKELELPSGAGAALNWWPSPTVCLELFGGRVIPDSRVTLTEDDLTVLIAELGRVASVKPLWSYRGATQSEVVAIGEFVALLTEWQESDQLAAAA